jgi:glucan phosphoethanolaminetransferase (alkaline phosphatase superfamily)
MLQTKLIRLIAGYRTAILFFGLFTSSSVYNYIVNSKFSSVELNILFYQIAILMFLYSILGKQSRILIIPPLLVALIIDWFMVLNYGSQINFMAFVSILSTDTIESVELILSKPKSIILSVFVVILCGYLYRVVKKISNSQKINLRYVSLIIIVLCQLNVLYTLWQKPESSFLNAYIDQNKVYLKKTYPINYIAFTAIYLNDKRKVMTYYGQKIDFEFGALKVRDHKDMPEVHVLILGETSRKENWQLYGYERATNPILSKRNDLIIVEDYYSNASVTRVSIPLILTRSDPNNPNLWHKEKSLISALKEAEYKTFWISSQERVGYHENPVTSIASEANEVFFLRKMFDGEKFDGELLIFMDTVIQKYLNKEDIFIVLHTMGSHFNYSFRYPKEFEVFKDNKSMFINHYDNSIIYTDWLINEIISRLEGQDVAATLTYVSDHGEVLYDNNTNFLGHGFSKLFPNEVKVPYIFWASRKYIEENASKIDYMKKHRTKRVSSEAIFETLLDITGVTYPNRNPCESLVSECFQESEIYVLDSSLKPINLEIILNTSN